MNLKNCFSFNKWYMLFFLYRIIFATILFYKLIPGVEPGDALNFNDGINSGYVTYTGGISTRIVLYLNIYSNAIFGKLGSFLVTTSILSYVLVKLCEKINFSKRYSLLMIFSLPTFTLFSLGLTKEFFIISFIGLFVIGTINREYQLIFYILFLLLIFIKPQVALIVICYFIFTNMNRLRNDLFDIRYLTVFLSFIFFFVVYFKFSDQLLGYLNLIRAHFSILGNATRDVVFFEDKYSYITKSLNGIYYLVFGPTISEAIALKQGLLILFENIFIIGLIILNNKKVNLFIYSKSKLYLFFSLFFVSFFVFYPSAVYNFVSAIRYRIPILILLIYYFFHTTIANEENDLTIY